MISTALQNAKKNAALRIAFAALVADLKAEADAKANQLEIVAEFTVSVVKIS